MLAQGNEYGDHCSLLRQAEQAFEPPRPAYLVHRLDREAVGLMMIAHSQEAAARLSRLLQDGEVSKAYRIQVKGDLAAQSPRGRIDAPLDGRAALTEYVVENYDPALDCSTVTVTIGTGRLHQIRRHFAGLGYPVMGDPKYGTGNKNTEGLRLMAIGLAFDCPYTRQRQDFQLPREKWLF